MTVDPRHATAGLSDGPATLGPRLYGFGSVFGKTIRDSRRATIVVAGLLAVIFLGVAKAIVTEFATPASRQELGDVIRAVPPILQGLAGKPVNVETLGGYMQYKYGTFFPLIVSLWSILALSGTLAAEARRGSLEFVAATAITRRRIALEKLVGHLTVIGLTMVVTFMSLAIVGSAIAVMPGDAISLEAAAGYASWLGLLALVSGSLAFVLSQFVGRGAAAGIAGAVMFAGFILNGYRTAIPALAPFANLTWFGWTANHIPLAGLFDWTSLVLVAVVAVVLFAIGVEAFARRDLGATTAIPTPGLPDALVGLDGPAGRTAGHALPSSLAWGIGLGVFGLAIAGSGRSFVEQLGNSPDFARLLGTVFPGLDIGSVGGFLQLLFIEFGLILAGLAAATLVASWASDETSGRLEFLLAAPVDRVRWVIRGGIGVFIGIGIIVVIAAAGIALGAAIAGGDALTPVVGTLALGLYALAIAGIGIAIAGVWRAGIAGPAMAVLVIVTWFLDVLAPAFGLPDALHQVALTAHYGLPMLGRWDAAGIVASLVLAVGGVLLGAWGFARRDLRG